MRARFSAAQSSDCHLLAMTWVATDRSIDTAVVKGNYTLDEGQVPFDDLESFLLLHQGCLSSDIPGNDIQAGGILIQAVNNACSFSGSIQVNISVVGAEAIHY